MTKIYVSPETLKKLSASNDNYKILNSFNINRPEPKRRQLKSTKHKSTSLTPIINKKKTSLDTIFQKTLNKVEIEESKTYFDNTLNVLKQASKQGPEQKTIKPRNNDSLQKSFNSLEKTLRQIRRHHHIELQKSNKPPKKKKKPITKPQISSIPKRKRSKITSQPVTFFYTPRKSSSKPSSSKSSGKKNSVNSKYMFDHSSPAAEYESRQVEFGHGRAKSKEWNDKIAKDFQKELAEARRHKPDWTDRFALK